MKLYVKSSKASDKGREAAYKMMDRRNAYWEMASKPEYKELDDMLWAEKKEHKASGAPENTFRPSKELRNHAKELGYQIKHKRPSPYTSYYDSYLIEYL